METSFGDQFTENDTREQRLPPHLLVEFYDRLKGLVVFIRANYRKARIAQKFKTGAGLIMSKDCVILTCSRVVPEKVVSVQFSFEANRDEFFEADMIHRSDELDLAILVPKKKIFSRDYAVLAPDDAVVVGMKVYTISHPNLLKYTFSCGEVTYPDYRLKEEVDYEDDPNDSDDARLRHMGKGCELIPINNFHGRVSSFGSPVFDSCGRIVGLNSFVELKFDLAVHIKTIKGFWNSSQTIIEDRRREQTKTTQPMDIESSSKGASSSMKRTKRGTTADPPSTGKGASKVSSTKSAGEAFGISKGGHIITRHSFSEEFDRDIYANMDLDINTKRAAQKVSASLVSLVSRTGSEPFFMGSGTIIESEEVDGTHFSTILTSASLLRSAPESDATPDDIKIDVYLSDGKSCEGQVFAYDFHYNIATIKIKTELALPSAALRFLDDSISVDPSAILESSQLRPHSDLFKLCPGDMVVAVGRHFDEHCDLMAAPGKFSLDVFKFDCKELFRATCQITKCGIGGPLINLYGEVIGVNFYDRKCTPFLPINIAAKCLEHFKKYGRFCRPWLGMEMTNLYAENLGILEKIIQKFPNISNGILVEAVIEGSPAESGGICSGDVIVQCGDKDVWSFLEFYGMIMEKTGESLELVVLRETSGQRLQITLKASETSRDKFYRWPLPEECGAC